MNSRWDATSENEEQMKIVPQFPIIESVTTVV
jgi:hypothetical protein